MPKKPKPTTETGQPLQKTKPFDRQQARSIGPCAHCGLKTVHAIDTIQEIKEKEAEMQKEFDNAMTVYKADQTGKKKPTLRNLPKQRLACYGADISCGLNPDGHGCGECERLAKEGKLARRRDNNGKVYCPCAVCQSTCFEVYHLGDEVKIRQCLQYQKEQEKKKEPTVGKSLNRDSSNKSASELADKTHHSSRRRRDHRQFVQQLPQSSPIPRCQWNSACTPV